MIKKNSDFIERRFKNSNSQKYPIIFYSLSSRSIFNIRNKLEVYSDHLFEQPVLLSLYDFHHNYEIDDFPNFLNKFNNLVILDSGGFESLNTSNPSEDYCYEYYPKEWNYTLYEENLMKYYNYIKSPLIVNYDIHNDSLENQIDTYSTIISKFEGDFQTILLIHPPKKGGSWSYDIIDQTFRLLNKKEITFNVLGVTEKELGQNLESQIVNLYYLREKLDDFSKEYIPIHTFGAGDPKTIILFFFSGADIFDGLSWLRYYFNYHSSYYKNEFDCDRLRGKTKNKDRILHNFQYLTELTKDLNYAIFTEDYSEFMHELSLIKFILENKGR